MGTLLFDTTYGAANTLETLGIMMMAFDPDLGLDVDDTRNLGELINHIGKRLKEISTEEDAYYAKKDLELARFADYVDLKKRMNGAILLYYNESHDHYESFYGDAYQVSWQMKLPVEQSEGTPKCILKKDLRENCIQRLMMLGMKVAISGEVKKQKAEVETHEPSQDADGAKEIKGHVASMAPAPDDTQEAPMTH